MNNATANNEKLQQQITALQAQILELETLKKENDFLRESLNLELEKNFDLKLAHIIAQDISQGTIIIDKGSKDLVQIGMPIITSEHALVGRINEIYDNYSQVALITAPNVSFDVKLAPKKLTV